jgi:hypothetical protein
MSLYSFDKIPVKATVQRLDSSDEDWTTEEITYTAAYGNEQATAYLLLPKNSSLPCRQSFISLETTRSSFPPFRCLRRRTWMQFFEAAGRCCIRYTKERTNGRTTRKAPGLIKRAATEITLERQVTH